MGGWHVTYATVTAEGSGCDVDRLEVEVGEQQDSKLVVNQEPKSDCSAGSDQCLYTFFWKCADLDDEEKKPKKQDLAVRIDQTGTRAAGVTVEHSYESFDGKMSVTEEVYAITETTLQGTQKWSWVSDDGTHKCKGEDRIKGIRAHSMVCDTDADDEGWDAEKQVDSFGETRSETLRRRKQEPKKGDENFYQEHVNMPYLDREEDVTDENGDPISNVTGIAAVTSIVVLVLLFIGSRFRAAKGMVNARFRDTGPLERGEEHLRLPLRG